MLKQTIPALQDEQSTPQSAAIEIYGHRIVSHLDLHFRMTVHVPEELGQVLELLIPLAQIGKPEIISKQKKNEVVVKELSFLPQLIEQFIRPEKDTPPTDSVITLLSTVLVNLGHVLHILI